MKRYQQKPVETPYFPYTWGSGFANPEFQTSQNITIMKNNCTHGFLIPQSLKKENL